MSKPDNTDRGHVLLTGGAGFIGSHVARQLIAAGYHVTVLDDLSGGFADQVPRQAEFVEGSILDLALLKQVFKRGKFGFVYHLAAYAAEGLSHFIRSFNYQNNLLGSVHLINLAVQHKIRRFIYTSSIAVYGCNQLPMLESMTPQPEDPYGIAKYAVELDLKAANQIFGLPYTIFRPHNVYGEYQNIGDRYRNAVGIFMNQIMNNEALTIFGDGKQTRAFTYIDDVAVPMVDCLDLPATLNQVYNIGIEQACSLNELAEAVMQAMGKRVPIRHLEARHEVLHAYSDHSKIREHYPQLGEPVALPDGLKRMAGWARAAGPRKTKLLMEIELLQNMPDLWKNECEKSK